MENSTRQNVSNIQFLRPRQVRSFDSRKEMTPPMCQSSMNKKKKKTKQKCNEKTSQSSQEEEQPLEKRPKRKHNEDKSKKSQASQSSQEEEELSLTSNSQDSSYISECNIRTGKRARKNRNLSG